MATVLIPTPLRRFTGNSPKVNVSGNAVFEAIADLINRHPEMGAHLLDVNGDIKPFVNIFVGDDNIRNLDNQHTVISGDTVISIVPAIAGGNLLIRKKG